MKNLATEALRQPQPLRSSLNHGRASTRHKRRVSVFIDDAPRSPNASDERDAST